MVNVLRRPDFGSRMAKKGGRHLIGRNTAPVVRHPYHRDAAVANFNRDDTRIGIDCIFRKLFHNRGRALNNFARRDFVDG